MIRKELRDMAEMFSQNMKRRNYKEAKKIYENAMRIAFTENVPESVKDEIFGDTTKEPPVEGCFKLYQVQKCFYETEVKSA